MHVGLYLILYCTMLQPWGLSLPYYYTLKGKSHLCITFLGIAQPQSQFPHSYVCEQFIYSQDLSTYTQTILEIYKSLTDKWVWELGDRTLKFCFGNNSIISGNTSMGTRHLYWNLTGPSFAVKHANMSYCWSMQIEDCLFLTTCIWLPSDLNLSTILMHFMLTFLLLTNAACMLTSLYLPFAALQSHLSFLILLQATCLCLSITACRPVAIKLLLHADLSLSYCCMLTFLYLPCAAPHDDLSFLIMLKATCLCTP